MSLKLSFVVAFAIALILPSNGEDVTTYGSQPEYFLIPHNQARAEVGLPPVEWDPRLAQLARVTGSQWGEHCELVHSTLPYAENICGGTGSEMTGTDATNMWIGEKQWYDLETKTCVEGQVCGHYENIIAPLTTKIGCAKIYCPKNDGIIWQCEYSY